MMRVPTAGITQRRFNPEFGNRIAKNLDLEKIGIPVVNHRDGVFWVIDGQHRIYGLRNSGFAEYQIECEVYENLTDEEMARIFDGRNTRKTVNSLDQFLVRCTAGETRESAIRRTVEAQGLVVSASNDAENRVGCVSALGKVYDLSGEVVLGQVLRTIKHAFGGDSHAFDAQIVQGLGLVYNRYNGRTDEKSLADVLGKVPNGARGVLRKAEATRDRTGSQKAQCVAAVVVETYNKTARQQRRLPSWWTTAGEK
jgi:hypothetical protein